MTVEERYLDILKKNLLRWDSIDVPQLFPRKGKKAQILQKVAQFMGVSNIEICDKFTLTYDLLIDGKNYAFTQGETMIGLKRLENIEFCVKEILKNKIEGDFIETGVWRGGAVIFMKALLEIANDQTRKVWVADSFEGLPKINKNIPQEMTFDIDPKGFLAVSQETVEKNFEKYNLLDNNVVFLKGWFKDTLPQAPIEKLALLRLDGDYYESTIDALSNLYPKLAVGGYVIIDDFVLNPCKRAVLDYRKQYNITEKIAKIDWTGIYWKKENE